MVTLVNYGLGNIQAFANIYKHLNIPVRVAGSSGDLQGATKVILPGVGSFDWAMKRLNASGLRDCLDRVVLEDRVPVLGVCVGLQMMARGSDEGSEPGLGWLDADVVELTAPPGETLHRPHMGWNDVEPAPGEPLFARVEEPRYYFLHSFVVDADRSADVVAWCRYGRDFPAAVRSANIFGTQFHPEKSHQWGIQLLRNFAEF